MEKILITGYEDPDLDATSCAYAYSELLNKKAKTSTAALFGTPDKEARFVLNFLNIKIENASKIVDKYKKIILVDASDLDGISKEVDPKNIIEIIDHRKVNEAEKFPNAKINIDLVGSAATLIAEKFYKAKEEISKESATLLYSAIVSNTINFNAKVTTKRDIKMAKWLLDKLKLPQNYVHKMFLAKSTLDEPLSTIFHVHLANFNLNKKKLTVVQLEIINVNQFVSKNMDQIKKLLKKIKVRNKSDYILLTCIDVEMLFNKFICIDIASEKLVSDALNVKFSKSIAKRNGVIMRKEIVPKIKDFLSSHDAS
jgi:manganese-dependent inorganic pyrophosphatase